MSQVLPPPCWSHRGCRIQLLSSGGQGAVYRVRHQSGAALGQVGSLAEAVGYRPRVALEEGMEKFVAWYRAFYGI